MIRAGLSAVLKTDPSFEVAGEAAGPSEAFTRLASIEADIVITDLNLGSILDGLDFIRALRERFPDLRILVNSMHEEAVYGERTLRAGTNGYVSKTVSSADLLAAVHAVLSGKVVVSEAVRDKMMHAYLEGGGPVDAERAMEILTDRELEIFRMIGRGKSTRQIAIQLGISKSTVESHRAHIKDKLALDSPAALVRAAVAWVLENESAPRPSVNPEPP